MKVQVDAYLILPEQQVTYAFYRNNIQEAVKQFGAPYHVTLFNFNNFLYNICMYVYNTVF